MGLLNQMMANVYKPPKQEKSVTTLPKHITPSKAAAMTAQTTVSQGQLLRGEVLDLRANQIMVLLENGSTVTARTDGTLELSIGQNAQFLVAQSTEDQILLKHVKEQETTQNPMIDKVLTAAHITKTDRSISIVTELLAHQQPVNEGNLRHYLSLSAKYPEVPVKNLVLMELHHLPITKENANQISNGSHRDNQIFHQAQTMLSELSETISQLPGEELQQSFWKQLTDILTFNGQTTAKTDASPNLNKEQSLSDETLAKQDKEQTNQTESEQADAKNQVIAGKNPDHISHSDTQKTLPGFNTENPEQAKSTDKPLPDSFQNTNPSSIPTDTSIKKELRDKLADTPFSERMSKESAINDFLERFLLKPEEIGDSEKIKKYYKELNEQLEQLEQLALKLSEHTKENAADTPKQIRSNLNFMEAVNQVFPYLQLPLKFREAPAHGELYVYEKKRNLNSSEPLSALLHLELENLGTTDIFVTLAGAKVTARFSMTEKESGEYIRRELPSLKEALYKKGYALQSEVSVREPEEKAETSSLLEQFLENHAPGGLNRYTFDIRA